MGKMLGFVICKLVVHIVTTLLYKESRHSVPTDMLVTWIHASFGISKAMKLRNV